MKRKTTIIVLLFGVLLAACAGGGADIVGGEGAAETTIPATARIVEAQAGAETADAETAARAATASLEGATVPIGSRPRIIRDGRIDLRVEPGTFGARAAEVRRIAEDLGGYLAGGETRLEEVDGETYTVGTFTLRVPENRFEEALDRTEALGDRLELRLSSQDVTEEYVDLESRLRYWRSQEQFYARLMEEATTIEDLVTIQTRMQDVLLTIEQIEGRLRYLEDRTSYATLTVGLTEAPALAPGPVVGEPGILERAIDQAGDVLLTTIGGLIVAAAFLLPVTVAGGALVLVLWAVVMIVRRRPRGETG